MIIKKELRVDTEMMVWLVENKVGVAKHLFPQISAKLTEGFEPKEGREEFLKQFASMVDNDPPIELLSPLSHIDHVGVIDATLTQRDLFVDDISVDWCNDGLGDNTAAIMIPDRDVKINRIFEEASLYIIHCSGWAKKFVILTKHHRLSSPPPRFEILHPRTIKG